MKILFSQMKRLETSMVGIYFTSKVLAKLLNFGILSLTYRISSKLGIEIFKVYKISVLFNEMFIF